MNRPYFLPETEEVRRVIGILDGMTRSKYNFVLFRDTAEVYFQFYLGQYLGLPTILAAEEIDRHLVDKLRPQFKSFFVEKFNEENLRKIVQQIADIMKEE